MTSARRTVTIKRPVADVFAFDERGDGTAVTLWLDEPMTSPKRIWGRQVQRTMDAEMAALDRLKDQLEG